MENKIWVAYYNPCIHESSPSPISFHRTEKGAEIALVFHRNEEMKKWEEYFTSLDFEAKQWAGSFGEHESWFIKEEEIEI